MLGCTLLYTKNWCYCIKLCFFFLRCRAINRKNTYEHSYSSNIASSTLHELKPTRRWYGSVLYVRHMLEETQQLTGRAGAATKQGRWQTTDTCILGKQSATSKTTTMTKKKTHRNEMTQEKTQHALLLLYCTVQRITRRHNSKTTRARKPSTVCLQCVHCWYGGRHISSDASFRP